MPGLLSISGLASGLDTEDMINQIMEFESRGVNQLRSRVQTQEIIIGAYGNFESRLLSLRTDFQRLTSAALFRSKAVTSSDDSILTATASSSAAPGSYTLTVDQLAQGHQVASQGFASASSIVGTGTFSLTVGNRSRVDINVDASNNTLQGLANAINTAKANVTASIVNTGNATDPQVLLLTGKNTGESERIVIDSNLAGGTAPSFGSVAAVVEGAKFGTTTISSSGNFTGNGSGTLSYSVQSGGTIGVDNIVVNYTDGADLTGSFTIAAGYVPGDTIHVAGGLDLSFTAGTLLTNDSFATDVTSSTIQAPTNSKYRLGNTLGGATGISLTSATNTITDIVTGLTVDLHKAFASPVTVNVKANIDGVKKDIEQLVEQYNSFVDLMQELFFVEDGADSIGSLLGERTAIDAYSRVQRMLTSTAEGVTSSYNNLADLGITISAEGKMVLNETRLDAALRDDPDAVFRAFGTDGRSSDGDVQFMSADEYTRPYSISGLYQQGYAVHVTQAAERARLSGSQVASPSVSSPLVINSANAGLKIKLGNAATGDILLTEGAYTSGEALATEIQNKLNADGTIAKDAVTVSWVDDGGGQGHIEFRSAAYGGSAEITLMTGSGQTIYSSIGHLEQTTATGKDVQGTINGEAATGVGQVLTGAAENTMARGLQLRVTISATDLALQGSDQGSVTVTKGVASRQRDEIASLTDLEAGTIKTRRDAITGKIDTLNTRITDLDKRLVLKRARLEAEFLRLETVLSDMQTQQSALQQALASLPAL